MTLEMSSGPLCWARAGPKPSSELSQVEHWADFPIPEPSLKPSPSYKPRWAEPQIVNRAEPYWVGPRAVISRASSWAGPWASRDEPRAKSSEPSPRVSSRETSPSQAEQRSGAEASRAPSQAEPNPQPRAGKSGSSGSNQICWRKIDLTVFAC